MRKKCYICTMNGANLLKINDMIKSNFFRFSAILVFGAVMTMMSSCTDDESISNPLVPNADQMQTRVIADVPTTVMSSFDENSMGAALVRRLSNTTTSVNDNTKMVLIKGEDILNRPLTEWLEAAKIYLTGGYIAIEKPHNAHLVQVMEQLSARFEQATYDILTQNQRKNQFRSILTQIQPRVKFLFQIKLILLPLLICQWAKKFKFLKI